ncbi:MAG: hypothetical protein H7Y30_02130, partial [Pyrinomonadaceae bacterium]|nr:hypothetical protein [Pyrinomonadaceae bacterium]
EMVEYQSWREFNELTQTGTADEILAAAEKATPHMRESYYRQAAFKLVNEGNPDRARQVISEHVTDPQQRQQMLSELDKQILVTASEKGKLEETRKFLSSARTNEERIMALAQLAISLAEKGDKKTALLLLEEARGLSSPRGKYSRQLLARMQIARGYAQVDPAQSFMILESAIDQLNDLVAAGILLGEFFAEEEAVKDDELVIQMFIQMVDMFQVQYGADVSALTRADFARTRNAAERFQRPEVRLLARLLVAQSALIKPDEKKDASATKATGAPPVATQASDTGNVAQP